MSDRWGGVLSLIGTLCSKRLLPLQLVLFVGRFKDKMNDGGDDSCSRGLYSCSTCCFTAQALVTVLHSK